jgi:hypothetical protein
MATKTNVVTRIRQVGTDFLAIFQRIEAALEENTANGFTYTDSDFQAGNNDLTAAQFSNLLNTLNTINTAITAGHKSNLYLARNN